MLRKFFRWLFCSRFVRGEARPYTISTMVRFRQSREPRMFVTSLYGSRYVFTPRQYARIDKRKVGGNCKNNYYAILVLIDRELIVTEHEYDSGVRAYERLRCWYKHPVVLIPFVWIGKLADLIVAGCLCLLLCHPESNEEKQNAQEND